MLERMRALTVDLGQQGVTIAIMEGVGPTLVSLGAISRHAERITQ